ncbi:MAG: DnaJ domain-containing protein [Armatimonadetes bacterium]|nr:DnaJ domain-containing protein [Armatimonadota bacterium]
MTDHYSILELKRGASEQDIRAAYRRLAKKYHPDLDPSEGAKEKFLQIQSSYEVLSDPRRKAAFDGLVDVREKITSESQARASGERVKTASYGGREVEEPTRVKPKINIEPEILRLRQYVAQSKLNEAEELARALTAREPNHAVPYALLGDIMIARGERGKAAEFYAFATQLEPNNQDFARKYESALRAVSTTVRVGSKSERIVYQDSGVTYGPLAAGCGASAACAGYVALAHHEPALASFAPISTWSNTVMIMLLIAGVAIGASLALARLIDEFFLAQGSSLSRIPPTVVLGLVALANFWLAALIYVAIGLFQKAFYRSTTRVVLAVAAATLLFSLASQVTTNVSSIQTLLWGGNLIYIGAVGGWIIADAFRN